MTATRTALDEWVKTLPWPWRGGMEATMFSHWIYRYLLPHAEELWMGHPARMKAITAGKKKSDKMDARTIADLLGVNLFLACFVTPAELEGLRRQMRFRRLVVQETRRLESHGRLSGRVEALQKMDGVGPVTALTWALEVGDPKRFGSIQQAVSYCGLASALRESAGQQKRGPLSKRFQDSVQPERQAGRSSSTG